MKKNYFLSILFVCFFNIVMFSQNFTLHTNGVTCLCPNAAVDETGVVNGTTYTKRTRSQITPQNAATTCTSGITDMSGLFQNSSSNPNISSWDTSSVTNMQSMFEGSLFNKDISNWDVSNVANMSRMFLQSPFNKPLNSWNVLNVTNMSSMFRLTSFNQPINNWNVSNVVDFSDMFQTNTLFNQPLNSWTVSNAVNMNMMFFNAPAFNQPLNNWNVSNVLNMGGMFRQSNINQDLSNWQFNTDVIFTTFSYGFIDNTPMSIANYDALLSKFDALQLEDKQLSSINVKYCNASTRNNLINNRGWTITGDIQNVSTMTAPQNVTLVANNGPCEAINVSLGSPVIQSCPNYTLSNNAPSIFPLGTTVVTWTLNNGGTTLTTSQNVTVTTSNGGTSLPTLITPPTNLSLYTNDGTCEASNVNLGIPTAQSCLSYTISNNAPTIFPIGQTNVLWTLTNSNGATVSANQIVTVDVNADLASICYITSDATEPTKNRIFINNLNGNNVSNYEILRETSTNVFTPLGTILPNEVSFLDNISNNLSQSYSYKIKTNSTCNTSNVNQSFHKTILLQSNVAVNNSVNLIWNHYQGITYGNYKIFRKVNNDPFIEIESIPSSNFTYSDLAANVTQNTYEYYVSISLSNCSATGRNSNNTVSEIKSNKQTLGSSLSSNDFNFSNLVSLFPNPTTNLLNLKLNDGNELISGEVYNSLGQKVLTITSTQFSVEQLPNASYLIKVLTAKGQTTKMFIKN